MNQSVRKEFAACQSKERREQVKSDPNRLKYHLMAPVGWLNDPNGLCRFNGITHIFYQYTPGRADGHDHRGWGHYTTKDYIHYQEEDDPFVPDTEADGKGSYSGSAFIKDGKIHFFYTGNNKLPGDYDYINEGRIHWVIHSESADGKTFSEKEVLMKNADYPDNLSCHVRDPKILEQDGKYFMVLGARTKDSIGQAEIFESDDLKHWKHASTIKTEEPFGYMWECPDLFDLDGHRILITCPQGMSHETIEFENDSTNGYFETGKDLEHDQFVEKFTVLDHGSDFYAPQSFVDDQGRRILIGWIGIPDVDWTNPTVDKDWQHALTMPRELSWKNGTVYQYPIAEMEALREKEISFDLKANESIYFDTRELELDLHPQGDNWTIQFRKDCEIAYNKGILTLKLGDSGYGRHDRHIEIDHIESLQIFSDISVLEIFVNHGEKAMTTKLYDSPEDTALSANVPMSGTAWELSGFEITEKLDKEDPTIKPASGQ